MVSISGYLVCIYLKVMCSAPTYMNKLPRYLCVSEKKSQFEWEADIFNISAFLFSILSFRKYSKTWWFDAVKFE